MTKCDVCGSQKSVRRWLFGLSDMGPEVSGDDGGAIQQQVDLCQKCRMVFHSGGNVRLLCQAIAQKRGIGGEATFSLGRFNAIQADNHRLQCEKETLKKQVGNWHEQATMLQSDIEELTDVNCCLKQE